jgi:signal transduction histidine kinase
VFRAPGAEPFDQLDLDLVTAVAARAGLALHLSRARTERLHLLDDRQQIGEELRHHVIHRLFRHGLALQSTASRSTDPRTRTAVQAQIDEVDAIIHDIRTTVFAFSPTHPGHDDVQTPTGPDAATVPRPT